MSVVVAMKAIKPKRLKVDAIRREIEIELMEEGRTHRDELDKTTKTWKGEKPKFDSLLDHEGGDLIVVTGPTGSDRAVNKWLWLNNGTKIRWALMSRDWRSKTTPRQFKSGRGAGRVVVAGRRYMQAHGIPPRPGIEAREWTVLLSKRRKQPFTRRMIQAMKRGAMKAF